MISLSEILDERSIELDLKSRRKKELIEELVAVLGRSMPVADPRRLADELLERERLTSTGIGHGLAIPHRLVPGFPRAALAFGRKAGGVPFDAIDRQPVSLFFLILGPAGSQAEHLPLLSRLSRLLHDSEFRRALEQARSPAEVLAAFREKERSSP